MPHLLNVAHFKYSDLEYMKHESISYFDSFHNWGHFPLFSQQYLAFAWGRELRRNLHPIDLFDILLQERALWHVL